MSDNNTASAPATNDTVKYGDVTFKISDLPASSVAALIGKGLAHHLGNVQASKITSWKETFAGEAGRAPTDEEIKAKRAEFTSAAVASILDGTMGTHSARGPRGTSLDTLMRNMAVKELTANLKGAGKTMPSGDAKVTLPTAGGGTVQYTREELITRRLGHATHGPRIRRVCEKELAALDKAAKGTAGLQDADALLDA